MSEPNEIRPLKSRIPPGIASRVDDDDRRAFDHLTIFLLACLDRMSTDGTSATKTEYTWLEEWSDEAHLYLETKIPGDSSGIEFDLNVHDGSIYARITRRDG